MNISIGSDIKIIYNEIDVYGKFTKPQVFYKEKLCNAVEFIEYRTNSKSEYTKASAFIKGSYQDYKFLGEELARHGFNVEIYDPLGKSLIEIYPQNNNVVTEVKY